MSDTLKVVADAIVAAFAAAVAGTAYEPGSANVKRVVAWPDGSALERISADTFYAVQVGGDAQRREIAGLPDSGTLTARIPVSVRALRRVGSAGPVLWEGGSRAEVCDAARTDLEQKLIAAEQAKAAPIVTWVDGDITFASDAASLEQWVIVEMQFTVRYRKGRTTR